MKIDQGLCNIDIDVDELETRRGEEFYLCCGVGRHDGDHQVVLVDFIINEEEATLFVRDSSGAIKDVVPSESYGCHWPCQETRLCVYTIAYR